LLASLTPCYVHAPAIIHAWAALAVVFAQRSFSPPGVLTKLMCSLLVRKSSAWLVLKRLPSLTPAFATHFLRADPGHRCGLRPQGAQALAQTYTSIFALNCVQIQGIGAGFVPKVLKRELIDEVQRVTSQEAVTMARRLATVHLIYLIRLVILI